ncbi:BTB domain-containing protein [Plasmodiophora brassicae]
MSSPPDHSQATWRSGVFADWNIVVGGRAFAVHRFALSVGPRSSEVLYRLFLHDSFGDHHDRTTSIDLEHTCSRSVPLPVLQERFANAFDCVLAYMYDGDLSFSVDLCVPVWRLADYLCLPHLVDHVAEYVQRNATVDNVASLLADATAFAVDDVVEICAGRIAKRFVAVGVDVWSRLPPEFVGRVLRSPRLAGPHNLASQRLAAYFQRNTHARREVYYVRQLVRALLENPRQEIVPRDGLYFLSLLKTAVNTTDPLIVIVASHFNHLRAGILSLAPRALTMVVLSPALNANAFLLNRSLLSYCQAVFNQMASADLAMLLSVANASTRQQVTTLALCVMFFSNVEYGADGAQAVVDVCVESLSAVDDRPVRAVGEDGRQFHGRGAGLWVQVDGSKATGLALEAPTQATTEHDALLWVIDARRHGGLEAQHVGVKFEGNDDDNDDVAVITV